MRLIDADALIDVLTQRCCKNCDKRMGTKNGKRRMIYEIGEAPCRACYVDDVKMELNEAPTIDAEPVRHGKWIYKEFEQSKVGYYECSECGYVAFNEKVCHYCYNCGAKMEIENDSDKECKNTEDML